jgi:CheY-like chemotaxis protein
MMIVVEDDEGVRGLTKGLLLDRGYDVITARNGAEGLARIESEPRLSIVITDIRMPGIDGWELARRARAVRSDIKVLYITGYPGEHPPANAPAGRLLRKPWRADEFHRCVEELIGRDETQQSAPQG